MVKRLEIGGLIVRHALLPASIEHADPCERQGPHSGLMGLALVALLLVVHLRPERMPDRLRRPCGERWSEERGTPEAPVPPGCVPLRAVTGAIPAYCWSAAQVSLGVGQGHEGHINQHTG